MSILRAITPRAVAAILALAVVIGVAAALLDGKNAKVEAKLGQEQHEAATASGKDAVETSTGVSARASQSDRTTLENDRAIRNAEGADMPVTDDLRNVTLRGLCQRRSYSDHPRCVQFAPAK